jgi:hypothetical protein
MIEARGLTKRFVHPGREGRGRPLPVRDTSPLQRWQGRLGRLVVVLQMIEADTLTYPVINLSPCTGAGRWPDTRALGRGPDMLAGTQRPGAMAVTAASRRILAEYRRQSVGYVSIP